MSLPGPLVDATWLATNTDHVDLADVRWSIVEGPKRQEHLRGHIPGAVFVDLDADLSDPPGSRGRHPLPPVDVFRRTLIRLGLGRRPVVCYDDTSGATAARLWWMLDAIGHPAAVLDGGIDAWRGSLATGQTETVSKSETDADSVADFSEIGDGNVTAWPPARVVEVDEIPTRVEADVPLLDARSAARFHGEPNSVDPVPGHIPGGRSRPWTDNVSPDGTLLEPDELRRQLIAAGLDGAGEWIASCGSGVTACHNLLAARVAGLGDGRLYPGSWSEWIKDPSRPVARRAATRPETDGAV